MTATVQPIRPDDDIYAAARRIIFTAGDDWPAIVAAAKTLIGSPHEGDKAIARNARARHIEHLHRQLGITAEPEAHQTSAEIAKGYAAELRAMAVGAVAALIVSIAFHLLTH